MSKIYRSLVAALVFLVPSNLFLKLVTHQAYVNGLLVDYLLPKLYLSDLVIFLMLGLWLWEVVKSKPKLKIPTANFKIMALLLLLLIWLIYQFTVLKPLAAVWFLFKIGEMGSLVTFFYTHRQVISLKLIWIVLSLTLLFQSSLAIYQFQTQSSLVGFPLLGEPQLHQYWGLAHGVFQGEEKILPYGTTPHPNVLAGFLVWGVSSLGLILMTQFKKILSWMKQTPLLILLSLTSVVTSLTALYLTQSVSADLSLLLAVGLSLLYFFKPPIINKLFAKFKWYTGAAILAVILIIPLLLTLTPPIGNFAGTSLSRRVYLNQAAWSLFTHQPLLGIGLNNFTARVEESGLLTEPIRFVQPVHHTGLLILSETGIWGILLILWGSWLLLTSTKNKTPHQKFSFLCFWLLIFTPILGLDHYLLTTQTGLLIISTIFLSYM